MKILVGDFYEKLGIENIFKLTIVNESLYQDSNDIVVKRVNLSHKKIQLLRARCSHTEIFISTPGPLVMGRLTTRLIIY